MTDAELWPTATGHHQGGRLTAAEPLYRQWLQRHPQHADGWHLLGLLLQQAGRDAEALPCLQRAVALDGRQPAFLNNLGELLRRNQRWEEAADCFRRALACHADFPEAHFNLANTLKAQGQTDRAIEHYRQAVRLRPSYAKAHFNLGNTLLAEGRVKPAAAAYEQARTLKPDWLEAHMHLGHACFELRDFDRAVAAYQQVAALAPDYPEVDACRGNCCVELGRLAEARRHLGRELDRHPGRWLRRLRLEALPDPLPADNAAIDAYRADLGATLDRWIADHPPVAPAELHCSGAEPPFLLGYQGRVDRPIKERYAELFAPALPAGEPRPSGGQPSVGVVVTHGHEGVFYKCLGGIFERMSTKELQLTIVCCHSGANILRHLFRNQALAYLALPDRLDEAAAALRAARFDLLHYWEVGTDSTNYFLPYFRPARVQSATWGWPMTTGNPRIDYYVSSARIEPPGADALYTERLVQLEALPTCYARPPALPPVKERAALGLDPAAHLYLCTQNLLKYHPDFDDLIAAILRADPAGLFLCLAGHKPQLQERLRQRWQRRLPDVLDRVRMVGWLSDEDYYHWLRQVDAVLDTPHYGGANTLYEALHVGAPLVTLAGDQQRGRFGAGAYRHMGLPTLAAQTPEEYVQLAVRLGTEPDYRHDLSRRLREASRDVFEDLRAVTELEEFFLHAAAVPPPER